MASYCSGGARATLDCAQNPFATRCAAGAPATEPCAPAGTECDPYAYAGACDGGSVKVCVNGFIVPVPCQDLGLVFCATLAASSYAFCHEGV